VKLSIKSDSKLQGRTCNTFDNNNNVIDYNFAVKLRLVFKYTNSTLKSVILIFVPGHAGVKGNERADMRVIVQTGAVMDGSDILNALKEIGRSSNSV
jgi:ribonuclease HI